MTGGPAGAPGDEGVSGASERPRALGEREAVDPARLAEAAVGYLPGRRWFRSKARTIRDAAVVDRVDVPLAGGAGVATVAFVAVAYTDGTTETYALPVVAREAAGGELEPGLVVSAADGPPLVDAFAEPGFARALLDGIGSGTRWRGDRGEIVAAPTGAFERLRGSGELAVRRTEVEQSNSSVVLGERLILKLYRRPDPAPNPEVEVGRFLTERGFPHAPAVAGSAEYLPAGGEPLGLVVVQALVPNVGDVWEVLLGEVGALVGRGVGGDAGRGLEPDRTEPTSTDALVMAAGVPPTPAARRLVGRWLERAELLGRRTAELHACLASGEDFAFRPEPWTPDDGRAVLRAYRALADSAFGLLEARLGSLAGRRAEEARRALALRERLVSRVAELETAAPAAVKIRIHGDLHAGQVLDTGTDFAFIDFEGEPARPVAARRAKRSALVDVAGMLRSFHYAAFGGLLRSLGESPPPERWAALAPATRAWYAGVAAAYLRGYLRAAEGAPFLPASREDLVRLLDAFLVEKATYELAYELNNRPAWLPIPLEGLLELAEG